MSYLLDTCVFSELVKPAPAPTVIEWLDSVPTERLYMSALTIGELRKGVTKLAASKKKERLGLWLDTLLVDYRDRILAVDIAVAENWGLLQAEAENRETPMASIDGLIAATAFTHHLQVVTRNESDFEAVPVPILNPWK